jgi:hypothetical protein
MLNRQAQTTAAGEAIPLAAVAAKMAKVERVLRLLAGRQALGSGRSVANRPHHDRLTQPAGQTL